MVLRERCREQSSATESFLAGVCRIISMCPEAAFLGLTFEPWGAAGTGGMAFINEVLTPFSG